MKIRTLAALAPLALVFGCASTDDVSDIAASAVVEPVFLNDTCPLMGMDIDPEVYAEYGDGRVGFCCPGCVTKWETLSDEEKAAMLGEPVFLNDACPFMGTEIDEEVFVEYGDGRVGFCCEGCITKWESLSDAEKAAKLAE